MTMGCSGWQFENAMEWRSVKRISQKLYNWLAVHRTDKVNKPQTQ